MAAILEEIRKLAAAGAKFNFIPATGSPEFNEEFLRTKELIEQITGGNDGCSPAEEADDR